MDFLNYRNQLQSARKYFTNYGWKQFVAAFSPTVQKVKNEKLVSNATPYDTPTIVSEGVIDPTKVTRSALQNNLTAAVTAWGEQTGTPFWATADERSSTTCWEEAAERPPGSHRQRALAAYRSRARTGV